MRAFHPIVFLLLLSLVAFAPLGCIIVPDPTKDSGDGVVEIDPNAMNGQNDNNAMIIVPTESDNNVNTEPENNVASEPGNNENIDPGNNETPADNAPVFLDFSASTSTLTDKNEVTFVAVLTDPDGIDDLIGGSLQHPGGGSYGAFQTSAAEGSYQIIIDWDDVNSAEELA